MKKKQNIFLVVLLLCTQYVFSAPISQERARQVANFFYCGAQKSNDVATLEYIGVVGNDTTLYLYTYADSGFVIVSADDALPPILGYSKQSALGNVSSNINLLKQLELYGCSIVSARQCAAKPTKVVKELWQGNLLCADKIGGDLGCVAPLITSKWGQSGLYNDSCPSYVGCVALAMGQVMRYHKWPQKGQGWHRYLPAEKPSIGWQFADFESTEYRWDLMPDRLVRSDSLSAKVAVAQMLYHAGVAVNMSYTESGSGAYGIDVPFALSCYFRYNPDSVRICDYADYTHSEWIALLKNELNRGRPIIYTGVTANNEGHAWVIDGYDENDYFHVNWGWDGSYDGYFLIDSMKFEKSWFNKDIVAIVGIEPAVDTRLLWHQQASGFDKTMRGIANISAVSETCAWASAYNGFFNFRNKNASGCLDFCRTTDCGESWEANKITFRGSNYYSLSMLSAVSETEAWAAVYSSSLMQLGGGGKILHTTDCGKTWEIQSSARFAGSSAFPAVVYFWNAKKGVCIGNPNGGYFEIYTTVNGGKLWSRVSQNNIPANLNGEICERTFCSVVGDTIFFSTSKGRLFCSRNCGVSWTVVSTPLHDCFRMAFKNSQVGVIKGSNNDDFTAYQTFNGGATWQKINSTNNFYPSNIAYIPNTDTLISVGDYVVDDVENIGISYSVDNGVTFTDFANFYKDISYYSTIGISPSGKSIWIGSYNTNATYGGMWYRGSGRLIMQITNIDERISYNYVDDDEVLVVPNPATDYISICIDVECEIAVYNALGHCVLREHYYPNRHIDVSHFKGGVYLVKLLVENKVITKRFVVQ